MMTIGTCAIGEGWGGASTGIDTCRRRHAAGVVSCVCLHQRLEHLHWCKAHDK